MIKLWHPVTFVSDRYDRHYATSFHSESQHFPRAIKGNLFLSSDCHCSTIILVQNVC
jgi:hypothetical protein